ncbi:MAG: DUF255 domain-containing protein [Acidobacteria bacterium]|nr:DUF255 domain-containing protein [Acidobacteriota bacterium]MCI0623419.1 DUF255 domain-containing protein [Acidobacteriota bacterium]MCI0722195.1 DUF255 domain-containing protein [Acidobacteriota bacterium]
MQRARYQLAVSLAAVAIALFIAFLGFRKISDPTEASQDKGVNTTGEHGHTNRLIQEKSPYLLQHAHNPVDWYPWGEEAFAKVRKENKLIFLSVGYSTCHWCHVMERESFENPEIARILNEHFVSIKVDREERPDVDRVYMTFVQKTTGRGGWPMSVWLTPDLKPFVGGTYYPPEDREGLPGLRSILLRIAELWEKNRERVIGQAEEVMTSLRGYATRSSSGEPHKLGTEALTQAFATMAASFDKALGGFGGAPKFPQPVNFSFLFRVYARERKSSRISQDALQMSLFTLRKMAGGGIHDQLGGGFHRYSVDAYWHVSHFERCFTIRLNWLSHTWKPIRSLVSPSSQKSPATFCSRSGGT